MTPIVAGARGLVRCSRGERGFSLVELLVALMVCALLSGAIAGLVAPSKAAFEVTPAVIDAQQRTRAGLEVLASALRSRPPDFVPAVTPLVSGPATEEDGEFNALRVVSVVPSPSQGRLAIDQPGPSGVFTLSAVDPCPLIADLCGFKPGATAVIADGQGRFDVFTIAATSTSQRTLTPAAALGTSYPAGSTVIEVESNTFELQAQSDGSRSLTRTPFSGPVQPLVDGIAAMGFELWADGPDPFDAGLARLTRADLEADPPSLSRLRRVDVWLRITALSASLRGASRVPDRLVQLPVALRNAR